MKEPALRAFLEMGFEPITEWVIRREKIKLKSLKWAENSGWLYAFVVGDVVKYVGLTTRVLRSRMDDYSYITEEQCAHKRLLILSATVADRVVWLYGKHEPDQEKLIAEESRIRAEFALEWNRI